MFKTERNLDKAMTSEAIARLENTAFAMQAMQEGYPQIALLFMEAAGAETIHGINHMRAAERIGSTFENLDKAANGEDFEIEQMYPTFLREAVVEGHEDAATSFHLALEREKQHRAMFKEAFDEFKAGLIEKEYMPSQTPS
ncbi:MAG TPA: rubrerythrin family protein [Ktedonobacteraceae bacterium]|nr:rubrerythrin family protein [Ktedonobacteraceae bacterium]